MLIAHLAKEWREQRLLLAMCAAVLLVLPALAAWLLPDSGIARLPWFAIAVLVGAVVLGTELVGGEARRGQLDFLARLPGAMRQTMRAKLCVLAGGILVLAGIGYVAELLVASLVAPERGEALPLPWPMLLWSLVLGLWLLATSCWWPATLTSLVTVLLVPGLLLCTPLLLFSMSFPGIEPVPSLKVLAQDLLGWSSAWIHLAVYGVVCGLVLANLGFRRVLARPRESRAYGTWFATGALAFMPLWILGGTDLWRWFHVDPKASDTLIQEVQVGPGHRYAFVDLYRARDPDGRVQVAYSVLVELGSGAWRQVGAPQSWWMTPSTLDNGISWCPGIGPTPALLRAQCSLSGKQLVDPQELVDAETAEVLATGVRYHFEDVPEGLLDSVALAATPYRSRSGATFHVLGDRLWIVDTEGRRGELPWSQGDYPLYPIGHGFRIVNKPAGGITWQYYDLGRRIVHEPPKSIIPELIREGAWLCGLIGKAEGDVGPSDHLRLYWPETGAVEPVHGLDPNDRLGPMLQDERVVVYRSGGSDLWLLDPETGQRTSLGYQAPSVVVHRVYGPSLIRSKVSARTPGGAEVIQIDFEDGSSCLARLLDGGLALTPTVNERIQLVSFLDDDTAIVIVGRKTLERMRFGRSGREVLFPR